MKIELKQLISSPQEISRVDIKNMKRLMTRLESKKFNTDDLELLKKLSSRFLVCCSMMSYRDGYIIK